VEGSFEEVRAGEVFVTGSGEGIGDGSFTVEEMSISEELSSVLSAGRREEEEGVGVTFAPTLGGTGAGGSESNSYSTKFSSPKSSGSVPGR
jgi:hypothetical protein